MYTLLSDLHLEFNGLTLPGGDTLLLAGDVCVASALRPTATNASSRKHKKKVDAFVHGECSKYRRVFYIAGNHEHYQGIYDDTHDILREYLKDSNVQFLHNETADLEDGVMLWAGTYWTDFNKDDWFAKDAARRGMNDFYVIHRRENPINLGGPYRVGPPKLHPSDLVEENTRAQESLSAALVANPDKKFVVMTHHCPSMLSSHPRFQGDMLNYAYCNTKIDNWIADQHQIKVWVHGHTHDSYDYMVDGCRVLCNPRGYSPGAENEEFNPLLTFSIN
jgi:predicted phosphodiesterase